MNHNQLTFAREYRGYSQSQLAKEIVGLSQPNLSKFEKGIDVLSEEVKNRIASKLNFPIDFFEKRISIVCENAEYRKRATVTKTQRTQLDYSNKLIGYLIDQMSSSIEWPEFKLHALDLEDGYTPGYAAMHTRKLLKIKEGDPVKNIIQLLELHGVIVVEIDAFEKFDGVSFSTEEGYPVIVINRNFSNDRKRFSIAHELGHIIMHVAGNFPIPKHRDKENEANKFASEFLMPKDSIRNSIRNLKISDLIGLKNYWLCSMASIIRRAKDLNCIDKQRYTYLNIELSRHGYKKKEPGMVFIDEPTLFKKGYELHKTELEYSDDELARAFNLPLDIIVKFFKIENQKLRVI